MTEVYVYVRPLPGYCHEMVAKNDDGSHTIIINSDLSEQGKLEAYQHARKHIEMHHFDYVDLNVDYIERQAHYGDEETARRPV